MDIFFNVGVGKQDMKSLQPSYTQPPIFEAGSLGQNWIVELKKKPRLNIRTIHRIFRQYTEYSDNKAEYSDNKAE